jgi:hypothetical protein
MDTMNIRTMPPVEEITFEIPRDLAALFEKELRIVVRHPWVIGIPAPELFFQKPELREQFKNFDVMLVPRQIGR